MDVNSILRHLKCMHNTCYSLWMPSKTLTMPTQLIYNAMKGMGHACWRLNKNNKMISNSRLHAFWCPSTLFIMPFESFSRPVCWLASGLAVLLFWTNCKRKVCQFIVVTTLQEDCNIYRVCNIQLFLKSLKSL